MLRATEQDLALPMENMDYFNALVTHIKHGKKPPNSSLVIQVDVEKHMHYCHYKLAKMVLNSKMSMFI